MNKIKLRMEMQLEAGDLVTGPEAITDALAHAAVYMCTTPEIKDAAMIPVPRGQAAYMFEMSHKALETDDGA